MTSKTKPHICSCSHPLMVFWSYDGEEKEFLGFPEQIIEEMGGESAVNIVKGTKGVLEVTDDRDEKVGKGNAVDYLLIPYEEMDKISEVTDIQFPEIYYEETEGLDGITRGYISVTWHKVKDGDIVKKYEVVRHVITAGCQTSDRIKDEESDKLVCSEKNIYIVHHPDEEWIDHHIAELTLDESTGQLKLS